MQHGGISIKAQCTVFGNGLQLNCKKKSKLSAVTLHEKLMLLVVEGKGQDQLFKFPLQKLKSIHRKFIGEGKITLEFDSQVQSKIMRGLELINESNNCDGNYQIFISNACKENLQTLINQILAVRKSIHEGRDARRQHSGNANTKEDKVSCNRKKISTIIMETEQGQLRGRGRKNIFQLAKIEQKLKQAKTKPLQPQYKAPTPTVSLVTLPRMLLRLILSYSGIQLSHRLISKQLEETVLKNIRNLRLKDQVDEASFCKLAKWAINLQGRFKNVKSLKLQDRYDQQVLQRNKAKNLKFGAWKQISSKHISQLKGLRIYELQIPYMVKFELSHLFGLRLVELRLKGHNIKVKNSLIKDQDILYLINSLKELKVVEVAYASTKLLSDIKRPQKMQQIKVGTLNKLSGPEQWANFRKFQFLHTLSIEETQKQGNSEDHNNCIIDAQFPSKLSVLQVGFNMTRGSKSTIPGQLKRLKLLGSHYRNEDVEQFFLPALEHLDITECPNLTPQCLEHLGNLKVLTNWNRNQVEQATSYFSSANIEVQSVRGFSYC